MSQIILDKVLPPSTPSAGSVAIYAKSDGKLYIKDEFGIERLVAASDISSLTSLDYADFDTTTSFPNLTGRMTWNDVDGTLNLGMKGGNVTLQIGQEQLTRIYNNSGINLTEMQVIKITGSSNSRITASLAQANSELDSSRTFAVTTENIGKNLEGFSTTSGLVRDINTSAFTEGATLYLSPTVPGGITTVKPIAPNHVVLVGWCVVAHPTVGSIYVNIQNGFELNELHDVLMNGVSNYDVLTYESSTGLWKNKPSTSLPVNTSTPTSTKTANYLVTSADYLIRANANSNIITITLPSAVTNTGRTFIIKKVDSSVNVVTVATTSAQTIDGSTTKLLNTQYSILRVNSNGTSWDII